MKLTQTTDSKVYFTSDPHYSHKNICAGVTNWVKPIDWDPQDKKAVRWPIPYSEWTDREARNKFCRANGLRDFPSIEKMNDTIVNHFNETVGEHDILFILGDIGFGGKESVPAFMKRLVCKNVHLIFGNHDHNIEMNRDGLRGYFKSCEYKRHIYVDGQYIALDHYAGRVWDASHKGAWMLYGHSHSNIEHTPYGKSMDVGVDTNNMYPYSFNDIKKILDARPIVAIDHHREGTR